MNLQVRGAAVDESLAVAEEAARQLRDRRVVFFKIDTALRGPVGASIAGLLRGLAPRVVLVAPAIPRIGRTTRGGQQYLDGVPIHQTEFAQDPSWPIHSSNVQENLARSGWVDCEVCDAETPDDLARVVRTALAGPKALLVGSLGLAEALALHISGRAAGHAPPPPAPRVLVISGSRYARSHAQVEAARDRGVPVVEVRPGAAPGWPASAERLIVRIPPDTPAGDARTDLVGHLTAAAAAQIRTCPPDGVAVIGGETAFALFGQLGITRLRIHEVFADVVSYGTLHGGLLECRACMLKGGSVGPDDAIIQMLDRFKRSGVA